MYRFIDLYELVYRNTHLISSQSRLNKTRLYFQVKNSKARNFPALEHISQVITEKQALKLILLEKGVNY